MKFKVSSSALSSALQSISKVISSKNTLPILDSFLFDLKGTQLVITASDVETRLTTSVEVTSVEGTGLFAIDAKRLLDPMKEISEQPLAFDINDQTMVVTVDYANGKFSIPGQKGDTYPQQKPLNDTAISLNLESQILLGGINRSIFATADDELRPVMNGIYFDIIPEEGLAFVASDGHKLVCVKNKSIKSQNRASFIMPKKAANLMKNLLPKNSDEIVVSFDENNSYIKTPSYEIVCRLIEGRFPKYESAIPANNPNIATVDRLSFMTALRRVSVFSNQASGLVKLEFAENNIHISAQDIDFSTSAEENVVCQYASEPLSIGFKASFLIEMLSNISAESVLFKLGDKTRAGVLIPSENEENEDLCMILMPMTLND